jgi:hypothetical protein
MLWEQSRGTEFHSTLAREARKIRHLHRAQLLGLSRGQWGMHMRAAANRNPHNQTIASRSQLAHASDCCWVARSRSVSWHAADLRLDLK